MKRRIVIVLIAVLLVLSLSACRAKFTCGICGKEVKGVGHLVRTQEKTGRVCDECYRMIEAAREGPSISF